ncbi:MAG: flagellar hook-length control protein [Phycisphaerales bacterium]|nr:flagellar hook-length control protein [Phycisphaerales bacterium]
MPPAMQNLFGIGTSSAPSSQKATAASKPSPSSRFEDVLDDARPKQVASAPEPPKPKPADKSPDTKEATKEGKAAGPTRTKKQPRRAALGKDGDAAETSTNDADATKTADVAVAAPEQSDKEKPDDHPEHAKAQAPQQPAVVATPTPVPPTQPSAPVKRAESDKEAPKEAEKAGEKGPPTRASVRPVPGQAVKKQAAGADDGKVPVAKPSEPGPAQASVAAQAPVAPPADVTAAAQAVASSAPQSPPPQAIAPRVTKGDAHAATPTATAAVAANAGTDLATDSDDLLASVSSTGDGEPTPIGGADSNRSVVQTFSDLLASAQAADGSAAKADGQAAHAVAAQPQAAPPEARFAQDNHPQIVSSVHGQLLPNGGSMQLRLDPPELGALHVTVQMRDGVMTVSFGTANDQATRLLTHSLGQLKTALESQGVSVEKLHVEQSPREQGSTGGEGRQPQDQSAADHPAQQEQQRREMLRRMWRRLSGGQDPLDLVA